VPDELSKCAGGNHVTTQSTGTWAEINNVIGATHGGLVVFDHHERVTPFLKILECCEQLLVVTGMEPDRRLVQDVEDAGQVGAELGGEPDSLGFSAGECWNRPCKLQIAKPNLTQKGEAFGDLGQDIAGNESGGTGEPESSKTRVSLLDSGTAEINNGWSTVEFSIKGSGEETMKCGTIGLASIEPCGSGEGIEPAPGAIGAELSFSFLPSKPGLLNGISTGTPVDIRHVEELTETAAAGTPTLG
jgi:hypothetical protein